MGNLFIMVGAPGSGKSTLAKEIQQDLDDCAIVSRDEIRFSLLKEDDDYFAQERNVYRLFVHKVNDNLIRHKNVIADATHLTKKSRNKLLNGLTVKPEKTYLIFMNTPLDECLKRNEQRTGRAKVPTENLIQMYNSIDIAPIKFGRNTHTLIPVIEEEQ